MLHVFMMGGRHPKAAIEVHDIAFANVTCVEDAYPLLREHWFGSPEGVHIDGWLEVDGVDGYRVSFHEEAAPEGAKRLFFVNLGGYTPGALGEAHEYLLLVAGDLADAKVKAKLRRPPDWFKAHTDGVMDVDDCMQIAKVGNMHLHLERAEHRETVLVSDYIVIQAPE